MILHHHIQPPSRSWRLSPPACSPQKKLSTPPENIRKLTFCTRKYPPQTEKKTINIQPKLPLLGGLQKTFSPFRGFEPPTVFFETRLWEKTQGARRDRWKTSVSNSNPSPPGWWPSRPSPENGGGRSTTCCRIRWVSFVWGIIFMAAEDEKKRQRLFEVVGGVSFC